ncbi:gp16 [Bacillus phage G]|uniref:Gp16 n=1 Tax=Bacillus phage G TaxID=2884420 RepID=G3MB86_9CAUD|nr:gp16 [Bacillus phage G]AEO93287.1 gp16 [Bacillus phage G]
MNDNKNLAIICDIRNRTPIGVICSCPVTGDLAFSTENKMLEETLEIILSSKSFLYSKEKVNEQSMINREEINPNDHYYLMAIDFSLPFPWRILGITSVEGDIEQIVGNAIEMLKEGGNNFETID